MLDTSTEAAKAQAQTLKRMGSVKRFLTACDMSESVREIARARIRRQHPDFTELAVQQQLVWELYGVRQQH